jgi:hypothetical protein
MSVMKLVLEEGKLDGLAAHEYLYESQLRHVSRWPCWPQDGKGQTKLSDRIEDATSPMGLENNTTSLAWLAFSTKQALGGPFYSLTGCHDQPRISTLRGEA